MKPVIVEFHDGSFGIRKGRWRSTYKYRDLVSPGYWWPIDSDHFVDCRGTQARIIEVAHLRTDLVKPVVDYGRVL